MLRARACGDFKGSLVFENIDAEYQINTSERKGAQVYFILFGSNFRIAAEGYFRLSVVGTNVQRDHTMGKNTAPCFQPCAARTNGRFEARHQKGAYLLSCTGA